MRKRPILSHMLVVLTLLASMFLMTRELGAQSISTGRFVAR